MSSFKSFWQNTLYPGLLAVAVTAALLLGMAFLANPDSIRSLKTAVTATPELDAESGLPAESLPQSAPAEPMEPYPAAAQAGPTRSEIATLNALWANCESATLNNARGEYPAMQRMSCHDYQVFAQKIGVEPNGVAPVYVAPQQSRRREIASAESADDSCMLCKSLFADKDRIQEHMRRYGYGAQEGERLNERLRQLDKLIYENRCSRFSSC